MHENEISEIIIGTSIDIHRKLGPGLLESVYEKVLHYELTQKGLIVECQKEINLVWDGNNIGIGFRADLIVNDKVMVELKAIKTIEQVHKKQLLTYLKIAGLHLGLLINFNEEYLKDGLVRIVNQLEA